MVNAHIKYFCLDNRINLSLYFDYPILICTFVGHLKQIKSFLNHENHKQLSFKIAQYGTSHSRTASDMGADDGK